MTEQEVIGYVNSVFDEYFGDRCVSNTNKFAIAQNVAIEALEKQIPKKPIIKTNLMTKHVSAHCSICDTDITFYSSGENYCHNCGQAIKWK